jgi:ATP-dependent Lon protease
MVEQYEGKRFPVLAARNVVVFPGMTIPLNIGRPKSVQAIEEATGAEGESKNILFLITQKSAEQEDNLTPQDLYRVGTLAKIEQCRGDAERGFQVLVRGLVRAEAHDVSEPFSEKNSYLAATATLVSDRFKEDPGTIETLGKNLKTVALEILEFLPGDTRPIKELVTALDDVDLLVNICSEYVDAPIAEKQALLENTSLKSRTLRLLELLTEQKNSLILQSEIRNRLSRKMGKMQRETILREQMKAIREELGDEDTEKSSDDYTKKILASKMPEETKKVALEEAKRLASVPQGSPETNVIRNYLDLLCALPWEEYTVDNLDLKNARTILDQDHYGLEKIKKRMIQYLAVRKLKNTGKGSILLLVGPPGVGKTSLGQSIAKALGRNFIRISLGGVRDDAEIRGHRRTYVGAMPGRIIQSIKRAGSANPLFLLDEIDKLARGFGGDPASALLEVLDPEQNYTFHDQYLDVPFDLSKILFIATANSLEGIPAPLLDRMEVVEINGYTTPEKLHIAKNHLLPKQAVEHGIDLAKIRISDEAMMRMITHYTREAGVRSLDRRIQELLRTLTEKILARNENEIEPIPVSLSDLEEALGPEPYTHEVAEHLVPVGVVTGLAWTPVGGDILFIEASHMPGTGKVILTGQLGDVMKESAQIALSLVRSSLAPLLPPIEFEKRDIHVHVPAGSIPKDGPSAGITMLTTLASLLTNIRVNPKLAMTGEITLRGSVMPVGGIKEKVMAAHRAGIERVILPSRNKKDLMNIPEEVLSKVRIDFVETAEEVLQIALGISKHSAAETTSRVNEGPSSAMPVMSH